MEKGQVEIIRRNFVIFLGLCFILGELAVASSSSSYYGVGLVLACVSMADESRYLLHVSSAIFTVLWQNIIEFCLLCLWQWTPIQKHGRIEENVASFGYDSWSSSECWFGADAVDSAGVLSV